MYEKKPESVGLGGAISNFFYHYVDFRGRSSRSEWGYIWLFNGLLVLPLLFLTLVSEDLGAVVFGLYFFGTIIPSVALTARRLRDAGYSPFWMFLSFVPFVGGILVFVLCLFPPAYPADFSFYSDNELDDKGQIEDVASELEKLQDLFDRGLIDEEQMKAAKNKTLGI
jgi:uncharacterized membrane protein YhaH (DUF805 family)